MMQKLNSFFTRYEFLIPLFIFIFFLAAGLPGNSWGAPALWNPDELIWRVDQALGGYMKFDVSEPDFNYPSLPKYVMYAIGAITYGMGKSTYAFIVSARSFSAVLGGLVGVLIYYLARMIGANKRISALAGLLYIVSGVAAANARFAHNDLYLQLFVFLCVFFVIKYQQTRSLRWLYLSFFSVGLAASSKYTGASMALLPIGVLVVLNWQAFWNNLLRYLGILLVSGLLVILGYGVGTPRLFTAPVDYLSKAIPAAIRFSTYGFNSGTPIGLYGQWSVFRDAVGVFIYYLFLLVLIWYIVHEILYLKNKSYENKFSGILILFASVMVFDLPFLVSINYIPRHFIPFVPFLSILGALFVDELIHWAKEKNWKFVQPVIVVFLVIGVAYSTLRLVSISLLFMNDARIPAGEYMATIRGFGKGIEYTLYPPVIDKKRFETAHNYPIYFVKYPNEVVPTGGRFEYNQGEKGLLERDTDYFVIDSYTYDRFYTTSICETNPVECDFFKRLISGDVKSFQLTHEFKYRLPSYLPQVAISAVNPDILIFERVR